jgi:hypothetical protein
MTLADLTTQFVALFNNNLLRGSTALQTTFINQAILRIQRELRCPMQESQIVYAVPSAYVPMTGLAIPNDFLELIDLFAGVDQEVTLQRVKIGHAKELAAFVSGGCTKKFARQGGNWILGPAPLLNDTITIYYYASFPALVLPTDTNVLLQVAWDAPLYAALSAASDYFTDTRGPAFEKQYAAILQNLQNMADGDELTADAAVGPVYAWPNDQNDT